MPNTADGTELPRIDSVEIRFPGPWKHHLVAANGCRFHVTEAGSGPLVLLLHGHPTFWWMWRHQLQALADAGYRAVAMDLRGYGSSDKPPRGYDPFTLSRDVGGVIKALGENQAVVVGHGTGGWLAWALPQLLTAQVRAVGVLSAAHPSIWRGGWGRWSHRDAHRVAALKHVLFHQLPTLPERRAMSDRVLPRLQHFLAAPLSAEVNATYSRALRVPFACHTSLEAQRWQWRSRWRKDGRDFTRALQRSSQVPVLLLHGAKDTLVPADWAQQVPDQYHGKVDKVVLADVGHLPTEEAPEATSDALLRWLKQV